MPRTDAARFLRDLHDLRRIGAYRTGVHRPTYTPEDMESRRWLMARMEEVGLEPTIDGIGNVYGRHRGAGPHLLVGSHIESQNQAGWLDGALGVVAGLALARAGLPVDVVAFADEEGHYGGFLGSRSMIGELPEEEIDRLRNRYHGKPLREALREAGLEGRPRLALEPGRHKGFLELHIEQGTQLGEGGPEGRRGDGHRGHLAVAHHHHGPAGPCGWHHDGGAARCGSRRGAAPLGHRPALPPYLRRAQHLDDGPDRAGARGALHHPGPCRDPVPVPRRVGGGSSPHGGRAARAGAGQQPARALHGGA
jgi:hypothetical protein